MEQNVDSFTLQDRRELIRQGLQLDKFEQDIIDLKVLVNGSFKDSNYDKRIRELEDANLILKTQRKDYEDRMSSRVNVYLVLATLMASAVGTVIQIFIQRILK
jgi:hypothetical protein